MLTSRDAPMVRLPNPKSSRCSSVTVIARIFAAWTLAVSACGMVAAQDQDEPFVKPRALKVCDDPNNLPFSNDKGEGFENKISEMLARNLDLSLEVFHYPQRITILARSSMTIWSREGSTPQWCGVRSAVISPGASPRPNWSFCRSSRNPACAWISAWRWACARARRHGARSSSKRSIKAATIFRSYFGNTASRWWTTRVNRYAKAPSHAEDVRPRRCIRLLLHGRARRAFRSGLLDRSVFRCRQSRSLPSQRRLFPRHRRSGRPRQGGYGLSCVA